MAVQVQESSTSATKATSLRRPLSGHLTTFSGPVLAAHRESEAGLAGPGKWGEPASMVLTVGVPEAASVCSPVGVLAS